MRILVTGASGFVGRHVCTELEKRGHQVRAAVRRPGSAAPAKTEVLVGEIDGSTDWSSALEGIDVVIHLAARVHVMNDASSDPLRDFRSVNVDGSRALTQAAVRAGCRRLIFASSVKVYGERLEATIVRHDSPIGTTDPYGLSKIEAEMVVREVAAPSDIEVAIIRMPLVYGPGVGGNLLESLRWLRRGVPLPLAAVQNRRSLLSVSTLAHIIECAAHDPAAAGAVILAADERPISTPDLLRKLAEGMETRARLFPVPEVLLRRAATMAGKREACDRLLGSFAVEPGSSASEFQWSALTSAEDDLYATGAWYGREHASMKGRRD